MAKASSIIVGQHPRLGAMFAAVDPSATYVQSRVQDMRFASLLTPFKDEAAAEAALVEAGAVIVQEGAK